MNTQLSTPSCLPVVERGTIMVDREFATAIGSVGAVVTYGNRQFKIHSVEGPSWYAFDDHGLTSVDCGMSPASWITTPMAVIVPSGSVIGDGVSLEVPLNRVRRGVCLSKSWA
jgi:hypothetical protein